MEAWPQGLVAKPIPTPSNNPRLKATDADT